MLISVPFSLKIYNVSFKEAFPFSLGFEILEDLPDPDILLVCCGGGGLLAGTAAAVKLSGVDRCRVFGVEPRGCEFRFRFHFQPPQDQIFVSTAF